MNVNSQMKHYKSVEQTVEAKCVRDDPFRLGEAGLLFRRVAAAVVTRQVHLGEDLGLDVGSVLLGQVDRDEATAGRRELGEGDEG